MPASFDNALASSGTKPAMVETGTIANVNVRNMTVDWVSQYTGKQIPDVQIMVPYLHYNNGEGITCVPEVGAMCALCFPSDDDPPFVVGFISGPELEGAASANLQKSIQDPGVENEEDIPKAKTTTSGGSTTTPTNPSDASFRAGRPVLNPGDIWIQGRDENFLTLKRGGVLQLGATNIAQRAYIPLLNYIRDFCENYELNSAAGTLSWTVERKEKDPGGDAPTEFTLYAREFAADPKASIKVSLGSLNDADKPPEGVTTFAEVVIHPKLIDIENNEIIGIPKFALRIDRDGNSYILQAKTRTEEIKEDHKLTVERNQEITVKGDRTLKITGAQAEEIEGEHTVIGKASSKENWRDVKAITARVLKLGGEDASEPVPLGAKLIQWLASHTHPASGAPPAQAGAVKTLVSKKVSVK